MRPPSLGFSDGACMVGRRSQFEYFIHIISNMQSRTKKQQVMISKPCQTIKFNAIKPHKKTNKSIAKQQLSSHDLFGSYSIAAKNTAQNSTADNYHGKYSYKIIPTDQSNSGAESKIQESIFCYDKRQPNEEYFEKLEVRKRPQKEEVMSSGKRASKLKQLSTRLRQMENLIYSQNEEVSSLKASVSQKELHRLMKIQSIERLKLIKSIGAPNRKSQKKLQK